MIDITDQQRAMVCKLLQLHLPDTRVWAYGSRVKRSSTPRSDLDLVVFSTLEQRDQVVELQEALDESDLPFRVDCSSGTRCRMSFGKRSRRITRSLYESARIP